jgi:hypothetical protein
MHRITLQTPRESTFSAACSDGDEFVKIRGEVFKSGFPASALITAKDFAVSQILVEIQSVAVIGERN